uniref:Uncharacterized protein n=1 Tax=Candidatus Kentrum sp. SD TaxID=2126332 RepID=A0A451BMK2_9GAMM|nr:MAG: hypothetical protein BECKSD772D_GA0070982_10539 [Candidatus Kentron sp. SD]
MRDVKQEQMNDEKERIINNLDRLSDASIEIFLLGWSGLLESGEKLHPKVRFLDGGPWTHDKRISEFAESLRIWGFPSPWENNLLNLSDESWFSRARDLIDKADSDETLGLYLLAIIREVDSMLKSWIQGSLQPDDTIVTNQARLADLLKSLQLVPVLVDHPRWWPSRPQKKTRRREFWDCLEALAPTTPYCVRLYTLQELGFICTRKNRGRLQDKMELGLVAMAVNVETGT